MKNGKTTETLIEIPHLEPALADLMKVIGYGPLVQSVILDRKAIAKIAEMFLELSKALARSRKVNDDAAAFTESLLDDFTVTTAQQMTKHFFAAKRAVDSQKALVIKKLEDHLPHGPDHDMRTEKEIRADLSPGEARQRKVEALVEHLSPAPADGDKL